MARRTKQEADETREALLDAAEQVFLERGVARASLDEVARVAGCTRGAVHWHFRDKLGLFLALDERLLLLQDELCGALAREPDGPVLPSMAEAICESLTRLEQDERRARLLTIMLERCEYVADMAPALERRQEADARMRRLVEARFRLAAARGELGDCWTPERAALFLKALISGFIHMWVAGVTDFRFSDEVCAAVRGFLQACAAAPAAADSPVASCCP
ncbi:TetR family transcriptional regulator [Pseudoroseomonas cervicalis]|uniref:Multidrug efflux pump transcriptional repressor BpeR n=1 Tax=Pseudoroseomonas cervicalis ATCC 49957 TaxID=525371 RepID=D5RUL2_9PROT|nr:TetR family transcriptional regulator [Pseudoroseomonas cervicalis]EFH09008.1 multidrug efflux pump transcriptional repressor BpeR [Pseudoroseomonas cervicalis ATCC 49957]